MRPSTGRFCVTCRSGTGAKLPEIWTFGSVVLGGGCLASSTLRMKFSSKESSTAAAALWRGFHFGFSLFSSLREKEEGLKEEEEEGLSGAFSAGEVAVPEEHLTELGLLSFNIEGEHLGFSLLTTSFLASDPILKAAAMRADPEEREATIFFLAIG